MVRSVSVPVCCVGALVALAGCGSDFDRERQQAKFEVQQGDYVNAKWRMNDLYGCRQANEPKKPHKDAEKDADIPEKQRLLWRMERGMIDNIAGDYAASDIHLDDAADLVDARRTESLAAETGTFLLNDNVRPYAGRGYEHIQVDYYRILNHLVEAERELGLIGSGGSGGSGEATALEAATEHYERAVVRARRMTLDQLRETDDAAGGLRYHDDPFARFLAGAVTWALPPGSRRDTDQQFAQVMFKRALDAYDAEAKALAHDQHFRYGIEHRPRVVERLFLRHALAYDPGDYEKAAEHYKLSADPHAGLPRGQGMILILDHVGFVARPQVLSIGFGSIAPGMTARDRESGASESHFTIGGMGFWAKGPGSDVVGAWVVPLPTDLMRYLTPGGMAVMGFEVPVHDKDLGRPTAARVVVRPLAADSPLTPIDADLEVVSDVDAYARATLKDEQPKLLVKTLSRALSKQVLAAQGAVQTKKAVGGAEGAVLGALVNLVGSATATVSESADTRAWTTLPDHVQAALIDVPAGKYSLELDTRYGVVPLGPVTVREGQLLVVPSRTFPERMSEPSK